MSDSEKFLQLDEFVATRRHTGLALSPDGERLIASVTELNEKKNAYVTSLWQLPTPHPGAPQKPVRLTRGGEGEAFAGFTPEGDVLFTAKRPDTSRLQGGIEYEKPENQGGDDERVRLFRLPREGGEAHVVSRRRRGFANLTPARTGGRVFFTTGSSPWALSSDDEEELAKERAEHKVSGILHTTYPVRNWDRDLGPEVNQLFFFDELDGTDGELVLHRVTALSASENLDGYSINADGTFALAAVTRSTTGYQRRTEIVAIDVNSGMSQVVLSREGYDVSNPLISPDGSRALVWTCPASTDKVALAVRPELFDLASGEAKPLNMRWQDGTPFEDWPSDVTFTPDSSAFLFTADHRGAGLIARCDLATGTVTKLTDDRCHYASLSLDEASGDVYALRDAIDAPPTPVCLPGAALAEAAVEPVTVETPVPEFSVPGTLTEVETVAEDGTPLRAWLCLPEGATEPAPFLLWVHGGPFGSWNSWTWRWNPWTATARGYAVLLPDPAYSTGYGQKMLDRGWGQMGGTPFDDIMRLTNVALEREDIDETRKAAMGGSYGGYMANWIAGHTGDFFDCIVTHASLYSMEQFRATTDTSFFWAENLTDEHNKLYDPCLFAKDIVAPMLVIHGDMDYRVPISEGLRLWFDLLKYANASPEELKHRFLYFPDENHWILKPGNSALWYETVYAFLAQHVLGEEFKRPRRLG
ncbi:S9 family peptidase [Dermabacteraceae bacterium P13138]